MNPFSELSDLFFSGRTVRSRPWLPIQSSSFPNGLWSLLACFYSHYI